jgi:hypothetical protein
MNAHVLEPGELPDALPGMLQVGEVLARLLTYDRVRIAFDAGKGID